MKIFVGVLFVLLAVLGTTAVIAPFYIMGRVIDSVVEGANTCKCVDGGSR